MISEVGEKNSVNLSYLLEHELPPDVIREEESHDIDLLNREAEEIFGNDFTSMYLMNFRLACRCSIAA